MNPISGESLRRLAIGNMGSGRNQLISSLFSIRVPTLPLRWASVCPQTYERDFPGSDEDHQGATIATLGQWEDPPMEPAVRLYPVGPTKNRASAILCHIDCSIQALSAIVR